MPKRSNDFQRLVKLVQQSLAPRGAVIKESVMVDNQGTQREIDVMIESDLGMYRMKVAVEAKDHSRALDVNVIEQIAGKYRPGDGILVNQVVVVSKSGFTKAAATKAKSSNMLLLTLKEAETMNWAGFVPQGKHRFRLQMAPHIHTVRIEPTPEADEKAIFQHGRWICRCCGKDHGRLSAAAQQILNTRVLHDKELEPQIHAALAKHNGDVLLTLRAEIRNREVLFQRQRFRVDAISIVVHFVDTHAPLKFTCYEQADTDGNKRFIQHGVANVRGRQFSLTIPVGTRPDQIVVGISGVNYDAECGCAAKKAAS